jgi:hypothetical protein
MSSKTPGPRRVNSKGFTIVGVASLLVHLAARLLPLLALLVLPVGLL